MAITHEQQRLEGDVVAKTTANSASNGYTNGHGIGKSNGHNIDHVNGGKNAHANGTSNAVKTKYSAMTPKQEVAHIFNSAIAAAALGTAWEIGLLDEVREHQSVKYRAFAQQHDLDEDSVQGLVASLAIVGIFKHEGDMAVAGPLLDEAFRTKSLFHWMSLGSAGVFSKMQHLVHNKNRIGDDYYSRDSAAIAYACRDINQHHFDPTFWKAMNGLDFEIKQVVDLGSGSGERLMQVLDRFPQAKGLGIDLPGPHIPIAAADAARRGYKDRLSFVADDARNVSQRPEFEGVDLLTCFMMGHDFWPRENCISTLRQLKQSFPNVRRFLLGDTTRILLGDTSGSKDAVTEDDVPIFTLAFEFGHALMDTYLPTVEQWEDVFEASGWRCVHTHVVPSPSKSIIFELEPEPQT